MSEKMIENNKVSVIGEVVSEFTFSHEVFGEGFYIADLAVSRLSDQVDVIPLMISERLLDVSKDYRGMTMEAIGQFRSYNRHEGAKNRLVLSVFVREIHFLEEFTDYTKTNQIFLEGYICKEPIYRKTPAGTRDCRYAAGGQPSVWKIRLHTVYCVGQKCPLCVRIWRGKPRVRVGARAEP